MGVVLNCIRSFATFADVSRFERNTEAAVKELDAKKVPSWRVREIDSASATAAAWDMLVTAIPGTTIVFPTPNTSNFGAEICVVLDNAPGAIARCPGGTFSGASGPNYHVFTASTESRRFVCTPRGWFPYA